MNDSNWQTDFAVQKPRFQHDNRAVARRLRKELQCNPTKGMSLPRGYDVVGFVQHNRVSRAVCRRSCGCYSIHEVNQEVFDALIRHGSRLRCGGDGTMKGVRAVCLSCGVLLIRLGYCNTGRIQEGNTFALLEHGCSSTCQCRKGKAKINKRDQILYLPAVQAREQANHYSHRRLIGCCDGNQ